MSQIICEDAMNEFEAVEKQLNVYRYSELSNRKKLFETLGELLSERAGISLQRVYDGINAREKLGSTYIGKGIAIPHCKLDIEAPVAVVLLLDEAILYSEDTGDKADIIFALLVPSEQCDEHLHLLSSIARLCEQDEWLDGLRKLESEQEISTYISDAEPGLGEIL